MRRAYLLALVISAGVGVTAIPVSAIAASASSADRARIALLVYQSQSARQADLRRGDAATRALRARADGAERLAMVTRSELLRASVEGASAKKRARQLELELEEHQRTLAEAAEKYTAELAKRDADYARERNILISTGERLLKTPEGRRVLDLYNAGGEANWKEAKAILDESRRVRRALDTRDSAVMYSQARAKGLETTGAVIALYEELLRDDPSRADDLLFVALLYRESGQKQKAVQAAETGAGLASGEVGRTQALVEVARARRAGGDVAGALVILGDAEKAARAFMASSSGKTEAQLNLGGVLLNRGSTLLEKGEVRLARQALAEAVQRYEAVPGAHHVWAIREHYLSALLGLATTYWSEDDIASAAPYIRKASAVAREGLKRHPGLAEAREKVAQTLAGLGDLLTSEWKHGPALAQYLEAHEIYQQLIKEDPGLVWYDQQLEYLGRAIGSARIELNQNSGALVKLQESEKIARNHSSIPFRSGLQAGLRRQGVALVALGREQEAQQRWSLALSAGRALFERDAGSHSSWAKIEQAVVFLDMAEVALGHRNSGRGLDLVAQAEALAGPERKKLVKPSAAVGLSAARIKGELVAVAGDAARSKAIFEEALNQSEAIARDPGAAIALRYARADLELATAKQLLAMREIPEAIERLRAAHSMLRRVAMESDGVEPHRTYAEAAWLMADHSLDESGWPQVIGVLERLQKRGYFNQDMEKLLAEARSRAGQPTPPVAAK